MIGEEYRTSEAAYYWMLSILSGKALDDLDAEARNRLQSAWKQAQQGQDHWLVAATVIKDLIVLLQGPQGDAAGTAKMHQILASFDDLPEERREEIRRHLDTQFTTGLRRQLEIAEKYTPPRTMPCPCRSSGVLGTTASTRDASR